MSDSTVALLVLAGVIVLFVSNKVPVGAVAILTALTLYATGLLTAEAALAGFGDPVVIFIASLFVVSEGIDSTGVTAGPDSRSIERAGTGRVQLLVAVMLLCAVLTAVITLNGVGRRAASHGGRARDADPVSRRRQMLMPLAFAGSAGALLRPDRQPGQRHRVRCVAARPVAAASASSSSPSSACRCCSARWRWRWPSGRGCCPSRVVEVGAARPQRAREHPRRALRPRRRLLPPAGARAAHRCVGVPPNEVDLERLPAI